MLRDLNTAVVCDEMLRGTRSIYVDYVDYDEIAHHAGMFRPESLAALEGLDSVLHSLEQVANVAPRRYWIILVSDHGQSQGPIFSDRYGVDLASLCESLTAESVDSVQEPVESWGRAGSLLDDMSSGDGDPAVVGAGGAEGTPRGRSPAHRSPPRMASWSWDRAIWGSCTCLARLGSRARRSIDVGLRSSLVWSRIPESGSSLP